MYGVIKSIDIGLTEMFPDTLVDKEANWGLNTRWYFVMLRIYGGVDMEVVYFNTDVNIRWEQLSLAGDFAYNTRGNLTLVP